MRAELETTPPFLLGSTRQQLQYKPGPFLRGPGAHTAWTALAICGARRLDPRVESDLMDDRRYGEQEEQSELDRIDECIG